MRMQPIMRLKANIEASPVTSGSTSTKQDVVTRLSYLRSKIPHLLQSKQVEVVLIGDFIDVIIYK